MRNTTQTLTNFYRVIECIGIFILLPLFFFYFTPTPILPYLWILTGICVYLLFKDQIFDRTIFTDLSVSRPRLVSILTTFVVITMLLLILIAVFQPQHLFSLLSQRPLLWLAVMILYPLLSVYPQEIIYRAFFFHRYRTLFANKTVMIYTNAFLFGYMHIIFHNVIAVILTIGGGYIFARLYSREPSLYVLFIAHSLYGCMLFTIGLGEYFYTGTIATVSETLRF